MSWRCQDSGKESLDQWPGGASSGGVDVHAIAAARLLWHFGPFDDIAQLIVWALVPLILWALIDWRSRRIQMRCSEAGVKD